MPFEALAARDPLVVLGVDPGTRVMGFGVVGRRGGELVEVDHGSFRPTPGMSVAERLHALHERIGAALDHHAPHAVSLEEAFFLRNPQSALRLGEARAVVLLAAAARRIPVVQYPAAVVKKAVCGHGGATKVQVQAMVARELRLPEHPEPHDAADALALAICLLLDPRLDPRLGPALRAARAP